MAKKAPRRTAERILEVTLDLFNRFGEPNVSTTLISSELNISPGNLYYHYPAKEELVTALFNRYEAALDELLAEKDAAERVTTLLQTARWLRLQNLFGEAARLLEVALTAEPQRWEVRKELAEIHLLMKRPEEMEKLFNLEMSDDVIAEVRMEVAQFLIARKMWSQARRMLEVWIQRKPGEFDARLLLAHLARLDRLCGDLLASALVKLGHAARSGEHREHAPRLGQAGRRGRAHRGGHRRPSRHRAGRSP